MALYFLRASQLPSFHACCSRFCPEAPLGQGNAVNPALGARRAGVGNLILRQCVQAAGEKAAGQRWHCRGIAVFSRIDSRLPVSCQPAHPHFPRATRGALNALLRPAVPRSRIVSPFEDRDLHPAERVVVMAAQDTQQDDDL